MNLMDMLSEERREEAYQNNDMQSILEENDAIIGYSKDEISQPENGVYYLPSILTQLQKDLNEIVLHIFSTELLDQVNSKRERTSINSLLDTTENEFDVNAGSISKFDKISLLFEQLRLISKHPSLLVDHFMPKKLLLLEVNERLASLSGKFQLFNRFLDSFIDNNDNILYKHNGDFNILVVAENVKELELIEGLIIGKKLRYNNLSSEKLFNDNRVQSKFKREPVNIDEDQSRKRKHHSSKPTKPSVPNLWLSLATSQQLYNNYSPSFENLKINLIFSFDSNIDTESPSIELIRSNNLPNRNDTLLDSSLTPLKIPLFIPILNYSIEHIIQQIPEKKIGTNFSLNNNTKDNPIYNWKLKVLNSFVVNRRNAYEEDDRDFFIENYGHNMSILSEWFYKWDIIKYPFKHNNALAKFNDRLRLNFSDDHLIKELQINFLGKIGDLIDNNGSSKSSTKVKQEIDDEHYNLEVFNYKTYKSKFAQLIYDRVCHIEKAIDAKQKDILPQLRIRESSRQLNIDQDEDAIGENYRKLRKLNDEANLTEKKMARAESELDKFQNQNLQLDTKLQYLRKYLVDRTNDEDDLGKLEQEKVIDDLNKELNITTAEYEKLHDENTSMSVKYQNSSTDAVQLSSKLSSLTEANIKLDKKLNGVGTQLLPSLIKKDELINYEVELNKLKEKNKFISRFFDEKLDKIVKERNAILDSTSNGSSSRPTNRISRASTPF